MIFKVQNNILKGFLGAAMLLFFTTHTYAQTYTLELHQSSKNPLEGTLLVKLDPNDASVNATFLELFFDQNKITLTEEGADKKQPESLFSVQETYISNRFGFLTKEDAILRGTSTPFLIARLTYKSKDAISFDSFYFGSSTMVLANDGLATPIPFSIKKVLK